MSSSHFGPTLRQYVLYQHFHNHVTQPLLHEELLELGVDISAGQVNRLLTEGHEAFHQEKDSLLPAAREVSAYLQTDDTSAMHCGKAGHTLHIGNDLFASFFTTDTKSRVNFLKILLWPHQDYVFNGDALFYLECFGASQKRLERLGPDAGRIYEDDESWEAQLDAWKITSAEQRRLMTEAALWASLLAHDLYNDLVLISDDAAQFKLLAFLHALCWVHMERHVARLIPLTAAQRAAHEAVRDAIWKYYQRLKAYRESPTPATAGAPGKRLRPAVPEEDGLVGTERGVADDSRQEVGVAVGSRPPGNPVAQQPVGERHPAVRQETEDQRGDAERRGPPLPGHLSQPEDDLPEARCDLLALSSGSHTRSPRRPSPGRPDPKKGRRTRRGVISPS